MKLFSPWALWFLLLIPPVILMYILKQKFEERIISSSYLWQQLLKDIEVNTPWQKLKKNILLLLQLLFIVLLVLALADPFANIGGQMVSNLIIVIDNSGSMNAAFDSSTRLEQAKALAEAEIRNSGAGTEVTIITSGRYPKVEVAKATDKSEAASKVRSISGSKAAGNINDAVSLVKALLKQSESSRAVFYTDAAVELKDLNAGVVSLASDISNVSLDYISHTIEADAAKVMVRLTNHGQAALTREVALYGEETLLDITEIELQPQRTETLYFDIKAPEAAYLYAELSEKDGLPDDNVIYEVLKASEKHKALLIAEKNVFIEKALASMQDIELYKTSPSESFEDEFDLYIYDGHVPDKLPEKGSILLINPPEGNKLIHTEGDIAGGTAKISSHSITKYMDNAYFVVAAMKKIELPYWASLLFSAGDSPAAAAGEYQGRKIGILAFDLHQSDFALTPEFPIFMHNMADYLVGIGDASRLAYYCSEAVEINPLPNAKAAFITDPTGERYEVELKYPVLPFENTVKQGIYRLTQAAEDKNLDSLFAVNFPTGSESGSLAEAETQNAAAVANGVFAGRRLQLPLIMLLLLLIAIEWVVYIRGY